MATYLRIASRVLRALITEIDTAAAKAGEAAELLARLRVEFED